MKMKLYLLFFISFLGFSLNEIQAQCSAGVITSPLTYTVCDGGSYPYSYTGEEIPPGGIYWWLLTNENSGGTGGTGAALPLTGIPSFFDLDASIGGVLPANGLPNLAGTWVIYSFVSTDGANPVQTPCSLAADSIVVTFATDPSPQVDLTIVNGEIVSEVMGGLAPFNYAWSDGTTEPNIATPIANQQYTLVITDQNGCNAYANIVPDPVCEAGNISPSGAITLCAGGSQPVEWLDFAWPPGAQFGLAFDNTNTDGTGGNEMPITFTNAPSQLSVNDDLNGTWSSNGFPPYRGTWAMYGVVYTDINDALGSICSTSDTLLITFTDGEAPEVLLTQQQGVVTANVTGGLPPYDYLWSNGETSETVSGFTTETDISVTVTDANGCVNIDDITVFPSCFAGILNTTGMICTADSFALNVDMATIVGGAFAGFGWSLDNTFTNGTGGTQMPVNIIGSDFEVTWDSDLGGVLSANGLPPLAGTWVFKGITYSNANQATSTTCSTTADSLIVSFIDQPVVVTITNDGNTNLTAATTGGQGPYTYLWTTGETTETITDLMDGLYAVTATDANGCTSIIDIILMGTAVEDIPGLELFNISPNPSDGNFTMNLALESVQDINISLYDISGKLINTLVRERSNGSQYTINETGLSTGIYLIKIEVDGNQHTEKLIIK